MKYQSARATLCLILASLEIVSSFVQTGTSDPSISIRSRQKCNVDQDTIRSSQNYHHHPNSKTSSLSIATSDIVEDVKRRKTRKVNFVSFLSL